ncbi:hypothetical protein BC833DRAFT_636327 [Globomyces pollinis-pini]|nr:hypothetical protein BC833DRAFT_636327 [Globomyces pollinis-pini]
MCICVYAIIAGFCEQNHRTFSLYTNITTEARAFARNSPLTIVLQLSPNTLIINCCELRDITSLRNLQQLEYLDLCRNEIRNISCLKSLEKLKYLYLRHNPIDDYSALSDLSLEELLVEDGAVERYPALLHLTSNGASNFNSRCDIAFFSGLRT